MTDRLRAASWLIGASSLLLPAAYYFWRLHVFQRWVAQQDGAACGMPMLAAVFLSLLASALLSLVATALNGLAWRRQPPPRSTWRGLELCLLGLPCVSAAGLTLIAMLS